VFDIRYHIASLVAVFLALTVGILLGSVIVDKGVLVEQQKALVEGLEARLNDLQEKNGILTQENNSLKKFQEETLSVIQNKLVQKKITVVVTGDIPEEDQNNLLQTLDQARASTSLIVVNMHSKVLNKSGLRKKVSSFFPETDLSKDELWTKVLERMAAEVATPSDKSFLAELSNLELIELRGTDNLPADQVVFFGGAQAKKSKVDEIDIPLIQQLKGLGMRVIGVEESEVKTSYIETYQKEEISTIDNVDQIAGKIALVYVLLDQDGHFGVKPSAEKLLPPLSQNLKD
jgi:hypothetical protein